MTTYTDNLRIPHLDQNVAQPEIPENTAKNIIDQALTGIYTFDTVDDNDIVISHTDDPTQPTDWQNFMFEINEVVDLTTSKTVTLPDTARTYIFRNSTDQVLEFKTTSGTGFNLNPTLTAYAYSDGTNMQKITFS